MNGQCWFPPYFQGPSGSSIGKFERPCLIFSRLKWKWNPKQLWLCYSNKNRNEYKEKERERKKSERANLTLRMEHKIIIKRERESARRVESTCASKLGGLRFACFRGTPLLHFSTLLSSRLIIFFFFHSNSLFIFNDGHFRWCLATMLRSLTECDWPFLM